MSNISKRKKEGARTKIKSMGDHKEFLQRITRTLYYGQLPSLPCLSLPVTEISCLAWSAAQRGRSVRRLHADEAAALARAACVSPCALVLGLLYLERLRERSPRYLAATSPADLFLVSLMVGNKFLQDDGEDDEVLCSEWAASGGLELRRLKQLEVDFLDAIEWNIFVNDKSFESGLRWLERQVALRQAQLHGFFTYSDLCAAAAGDAALLGEVARGAAAAAGAALAGLLALLASALLVAQACLNAPAAAPAPSRLDTTLSTASSWAPDVLLPSSQNDLAPTTYISNSNSTLPFEFSIDAPLDEPAERVQCCTKWLQYQAPAPQKSWYDSGTAYDWNSLRPWWWWRTSVLNWLYQSSLVNPVQRWLERVDEYADLFRQTAWRSVGCAEPSGLLRGARRRPELLRPGAAVSDR